MHVQLAKLSLPRILWLILILGAGSILFPAALQAQQQQPPSDGTQPSRPVRTPVFDRLRERNERTMREMELRSVEMMASSQPAEPVNPRIAYEHVREDYRRLQVVNNDMMRQTFGNGAPATINYRLVSRASQEINRRASRLRSTLQLPELDEADQPQAGAEITTNEQLRASLISLDTLVTNFVTSPIFQNPGVMDVEASTAARRNLDAMIELSKKIRRSADRMRN